MLQQMYRVVLTGDIADVFRDLKLAPCSCCFRMHNTLRNAFTREMSQSPEQVLELELHHDTTVYLLDQLCVL